MGRRILACTNAYPPNSIGGAEVVVHEHAKAMNRAGNHVVVFSGVLNPAGIRHAVTPDAYEGVTVFRVVLHHADYDWSRVNFPSSAIDSEFLRILDRFQPEAVHFHNIQGLCAGVIREVRRRGIRTVLTLHDHWGFCFKNTLLKRGAEVCDDFAGCADCMRFVVTDEGEKIPIRLRNDYLRYQLDAIDRIISPSAYLAEAYVQAGFPEAKMRIIDNGVNVQRFRSLGKSKSDRGLRFTYIGRLAFHKGVHVLLSAFKSLSGRAAISLNLVGSGELTEEFANLIGSIRLNGRVKLFGNIANREIAAVLRDTDVFVLSSVWPENQPVTILEALASGTPVISSRIGGIPELIRDGENGFLVPPADAAALAASMERFVRNPSLLESMGRAAMASVAGMTVDNSVERVLAAYDEQDQPVSPDVLPTRKILCVGRKLDPKCITALESLSILPLARNWRFLWDQWVVLPDMERPDLIWVVDRAVTNDDLACLDRGRVTRVVPYVNNSLRRTGKRLHGDVVYQTADEIRAAISGCLS